MIHLKLINEYLNTKAVDFFYASLQDKIKSYVFNNNTLFEEKIGSYKELYIGNVLPTHITKVEKVLTDNLKLFTSKHELSFFIKPVMITVNQQMLFCFHIIIRDPKTKRIIPPKYIFHATTKKNLDAISTNGLLINKSDFTKWSESMFYHNAIFCSTNPDNIFNFINESVIVLDTFNMKNIWYRDINSKNDDWIMTYSDISSEYIVDIYDIDIWDDIKKNYIKI